MTMDIDYTGEDYAFPSDFTVVPAKGLTKEEYIATALMAALLANPQYSSWTIHETARQAINCCNALKEELGL